MLHPGGQVDRVPHRGVLQTEIGADLAHHDQAGVDPDPHVEIEPPLCVHPLSVRSYPVHDLQPGEHRPLRVVLVGDRCAEEGQHRVAHQAGQGALQAVDWGDQVLEGTVHDLGPIFGVHSLGRGGGAFDVTKEDRHHPALAFHTMARTGCLEFGEQLFWNVLQQLFLGGEPGGTCQSLSAVAAEIGGEVVLCPTIGTGPSQ